MVSITATFCCLPHRKISNQQLLTEHFKGSKEKAVSAASIQKHTGIAMRRYAQTFEAASHLAQKAIFPLFLSQQFLKQDVECLIVATTSGDCPSPATASFVHGQLGLSPHTISFDVSSSCTSFLSAVGCAQSFVKSNLTTLVVATEVKHKSLQCEDIRTMSLFSDGAAGVYLQQSSLQNSHIGISYVEGDSSLVGNICTPAGGSKEPTTQNNLARNKLAIFQPKIMFVHTVKSLTKAIQKMHDDLLKKEECLNLIFIHQANRNILQRVKDNLPRNISSKLLILMADIGNTACASLPILRARVNFMRALIFYTGKKILKKNLLKEFKNLAKEKNHFSYEAVNGGILFTAKWQDEWVFLFDDGCRTLEETWLYFMCEEEYAQVSRILWTEFKNQKSKKIIDFWVVAGGGFQTMGLKHEYSLNKE